MMSEKPKALIVLSGGQDSVTCLANAIYEGAEVVEALFFDYRQQHCFAEFQCAKKAAEHFKVPLHCMDLTQPFAGVTSNLTEKDGDVSVAHSLNPDLPASFVPGRNLMFLTIACMRAYCHKVPEVITGVCETDFSGYPDCRKATIEMLELSINAGFGTATNNKEDPLCWDVHPGYVEIITPLMYIDKADTFKMAEDAGALDFVLENTHTGYTGSRGHRYEWGYGPPEGVELDPASAIRAKGWEEFKERYR